MRHHLLGMRELRKQLQGDSRGIEHLELFAASDGLRRRQPQLLDQLDCVVNRLLLRRRHCKEKSRIPALGANRRCHPAGVIGDAIRGQLQSELCAKRIDGRFTLMQPLAPGSHFGIDLADRLTIGPVRQQQPRFLEAFAKRRHVVVKPALGQAHAGTGGNIIEAATVPVSMAVLGVEQAAWKHPGTACLIAAFGAPQQQHFQAL